MDSNFESYDFLASFERIDAILAASNANFQETASLPARDTLTFDNGFHALCTVLFIDIRNSSALPDIYETPALAKLYRAYISETVAVFNSHPMAKEINIVGDRVWAVYNTPEQADIDGVFGAIARTQSMLKLLNHKLGRFGYAGPIVCGQGVSYGPAIMIKGGHNGSAISDVVYVGDVVNRAAQLAAEANKGGAPPILLESDFQAQLSHELRRLTHYDHARGCYGARVRSPAMESWFVARGT
ncbi:adenylate/guanylate cyclase domain-containing protein [Arthrobacter sp. 35W]|uniref:adenylate/guanylate cyclase domain-containing protein n=1 Tax=Arthrobacter sp. 35W TaxID=1132441 RepID=UPI0003F59BF8|nr:adenylate/guanylate cyclase domain-containing protein [Arthrobacter sp. 35W]